jgi:predicted nucleic acid-binding protein
MNAANAVYVETNFVLERAFEQEQSESCHQFLKLAAEGRITLVIPAFSLAEPHDAVARKASMRSSLKTELKRQLGDLGRSKSFRHLPITFDSLAEALTESADLEREGVRKTVGQLLKAAEVIPMTGGILASASEMQDRFGISGQDSIVLAWVLSDLDSRRPHASCFINRNSRDFDDPNIRKQITAFNCKFFTNFDDGLDFVIHQLAIR